MTFYCGSGGGVYITTEHDVAGEAHMDAMREQYFKANGEWPAIDQSMPWFEEGFLASQRRLAIADSQAITEATAVLKRHGYRVTAPK